jgi:hypothetical protein
MRETCLMCVSKHIAQAIVLVIEAQLGYQLHLWLAVGHLAEAESECIEKYPCFSNNIRKVRMVLSGQEGVFKSTDLMDLLEQARDIAAGINGKSEEQRQHELFHEQVAVTKEPDLTPIRRLECDYNNCTAKVEYKITWGSNAEEDFNHSCANHVGHLLLSGSPNYVESIF